MAMEHQRSLTLPEDLQTPNKSNAVVSIRGRNCKTEADEEKMMRWGVGGREKTHHPGRSRFVVENLFVSLWACLLEGIENLENLARLRHDSEKV